MCDCLMKSLKSYMLRVSNVSSNCREVASNKGSGSSWSVILPPSLRDKGACAITVVQGTLYTDGGKSTTNGSEYGVESMISAQGFSTETDNGINENYKTLFVANTTNDEIEFKLDIPYTFHCPSLPETLDFNTYQVSKGTGKEPLPVDYVSFTLHLQFFN